MGFGAASRNALVPIVLALFASSSYASRVAYFTEDLIRRAEFIVVGEVLDIRPLGNIDRSWATSDGSSITMTTRTHHVRVDCLLRVEESLKGHLAPGSVIRIVHFDDPSLGTAQPRDVAHHPRTGALWFLNRDHRGTYRIAFDDAVHADSEELRREIALYENTRDGLNALFVAREAADVTSAIAGGLDVNVQDYNGDTALHWAIEHDRADVVRALLDNGARTDIAGHFRQNALDVAIHLHRDEIKAMLIERGAKAYGLFLLNKPLSDFDSFLSYGADVNAGVGFGMSPVLVRVHRLKEGRGTDEIDKLKWLLGHGALPSHPPGQRQPLHEALAHCSEMARMRPVAALLLAAGADVNATPFMKSPILSSPVLCGDVDTVVWLAAHGADPNAVDECGFTVLFAYFESLSDEMIRTLVGLGGNMQRGETTKPYCASYARFNFEALDKCRSDPACAVADVVAALDPRR